MRRALGAFWLALGLLLFCVWKCPAEEKEGAEDRVWAYMMEREEIRRRYLEELEGMRSAAWAQEEEKRQAGRMILTMLSRMEQEISLEAVLGQMGYGGCAVSVREEAVYVAAAGVREEDTAAILETVMRETGKSASCIRIFPV